MALNIPQGVLYLPMLALWITLVGAMLNHESVVVLTPLVFGLGVGVVMATRNVTWLFLPVIAIWLVGIGTMIYRHRDDVG